MTVCCSASSLTLGESKLLGIAQRLGDLLAEIAGPIPESWTYDDRKAVAQLLKELAQARRDDPESWEVGR